MRDTWNPENGGPENWDPENLPPRDGAVLAVTGATSGIGYFVAEQLASTGAHVLLLGRQPGRLDRARQEIEHRHHGASLSSVTMDLSDLGSVAAAAAELRRLPRLDGLIANAGLVAVAPERRTTADGHELAMGTNHLGHFALLAGTMEVLARTPDSRVVSAGSYITQKYPFDRSDLLSERRYAPRRAYAQSKHANEIFGFELDRRLRRAGSTVTSVVAHPGGALEQMSPHRPGIGGASRPTRAVLSLAGRFAQGKDRGAWPLVRAALDGEVSGGDYLGPQRRTHGRPVHLEPVTSQRDPGLGAWLWERSEELTRTRFRVVGAPASHAD